MRRLLSVLLLVYAAIAGLRTVVDFDLGWQMADARHPWSAVDTLSYTVPGATWIYPPLAGLIFRGLFALGGYASISFLCAGVLVATAAVIAYRSRPAVLLMLIVAMPALSRQVIPRSSLFTVLLAACMVRVLLTYKQGGRARLWLLPVLMVLWVNLHPGFIAGLALMLGYVAAEFVDSLRGSDRQQSRQRLRRMLPWLIRAAAATLINPWGWRMYQAVISQESPTEMEAQVVREIAPLYTDFSKHVLNPLDPLNAIWWVIGLSIVALFLLLRQKRFGLALFLTLGIVACLDSGRAQGIFIPIAGLVAGDAFARSLENVRMLRPPAMAWAGFAVVSLLVGVRSFDIVTNRSFVREDEITAFGAGPSWWLPQRAVEYIEQHHLPTELFTSYNLGSYVAGRLGPHYRDFADGRYLPFRERIIDEQMRLSVLPLDSPAWNDAAARWQIKTVILPLARFYGIPAIPLREDCTSQKWTPVYLDSDAIVLVRNDAIASDALAAMRIDCQQASLTAGTEHSRIAKYEQLANAAVVYFLLGRDHEAEDALAQSQKLFGGDDSLLMLAGELQASRNDLASAQNSFLHALELRESDGAWYQLGIVYAQEQDYLQAIHAFQRALALEVQPSFMIEDALARAQVFAEHAGDALSTLNVAALHLSNTPDEGAARAELADLEAAADAQLANWPAAIAAEQRALAQTPGVPRRWQALATIYAAAGQNDEAARARAHAESLADGSH